jgi:hypothetical protein
MATVRQAEIKNLATFVKETTLALKGMEKR